MGKKLLTVLLALNFSLCIEAQTALLGNIQWGQENPYNLKCPVMNKVVYQGSADKRAHTGCVATAMSQLMRYWQWPVQPTGRCTYQSVDSKQTGYNIFNIDNNLDDHSYDWSMMPEDYHNVTDSAKMLAVAQLMFDCGSSVQMQYTSYTSDAGHINAAKALTENFSYFKSGMQSWYRNTTSDSIWHKVIKTEIEAGRPILIEGFGEQGGFGHEYIIDGYDEANDKVHVNFGFENTGGWYPMYSHYTYTANFGIVTGIRPNRDGASDGAFTPNIHRLNDMQYRDKAIHFRLRNDGLGAATTSYGIYTSLAVVRNGKIAGLAANAADGTSASQRVLLNVSHDDGYDFSPSDLLSSGTATYPDVSSVAFSPSDVAIRNVSASTDKINVGDILVPMLSVDGGRTWQIADGNESHINSLKVTLDPTPEPVSYTYNIYLHGAPYKPGGVNPYIIYDDGYGDAYCYDDFIEMGADLKSTDIKAKSVTGYSSRIWIRHSGNDHEIHVTYCQNADYLKTYTTYNISTASTFYNLVDADGNYLYVKDGKVLSSSSVDANSASAAWALGYQSATFSSNAAFYFYNKAAQGYLYSLTDGSLAVGSATTSARKFFLTPSLDAGSWLLQNSTSTSGSYLQLGTEPQLLTSDEAIWGVEGTETSAIKLGDECYGMNSTKIRFQKIEAVAVAGDVNEDGTVDIADVTAVLNVMYGGTEHAAKADVNGDGTVDIADVTAVLNIMYSK